MLVKGHRLSPSVCSAWIVLVGAAELCCLGQMAEQIPFNSSENPQNLGGLSFAWINDWFFERFQEWQGGVLYFFRRLATAMRIISNKTIAKIMTIPCKVLLLLHINIMNDNNDYTVCINSGQTLSDVILSGAADAI